MTEFHEGDLVWARIAGLPYWPGQVLHPDSKLAQNPKIQRRRTNKPGIVLVSFFGDSTYNWLDRGCLEPFQKFYEKRKNQPVRQKHLQEIYVIAVQEAKELWDCRDGRDPETDHEPIDFLNPDTWPYIDGPTPPPPPATAADVELVNTKDVLAWMRSIAANPLSCPKALLPENLAAQRLLCSAYWRPPAEVSTAEQEGKQHTESEKKPAKARSQHAESEKKPSKPRPQHVEPEKKPAKTRSQHVDSEKKPPRTRSQHVDTEPKSAKTRSQGKKETAQHIKHADSSAEDAEKEPPVEKPATRKRKVPEIETQATADAADGEVAAPPTAKRRGRPPRSKQAQADQPTTTTPAMEKATSKDIPTTAAEPTPKEKREKKKSVKQEEQSVVKQEAKPAGSSAASDRGTAGISAPGGGKQVATPATSGAGAAGSEQPQRKAQDLLHPLTVEMETMVKTIKAAARNPRLHMKQRRATNTTLEAEAAILLFRELECAESMWNRTDTFGRPTERALIRCGALPRPPPQPEPEAAPAAAQREGQEVVEPAKKPKLNKDKKKDKTSGREEDATYRGEGENAEGGEGSSGEEEDAKEAPGRGRAAVRPPSKLEMVDIVVKDYAHRIGTRDQFEANLQRYYGEKNQSMGMSVVQGEDLDMYTIFKAVAQRGGYDAVEKTYGAWRQVALAWRPQLADKKNIRQYLSKAYRKHLLPFELTLSATAPTRTANVRPSITRSQAPLDYRASTVSPPAFQKRRLTEEEEDEDEAKLTKKPRNGDTDSGLRKFGNGGRSEGSSGLQRIMLKFPSGISLPSKSQVQALTKEFGDVSAENILMDRNKSAITITFSTAEEAANAAVQLGTKVEGGLNLPPSTVKVSMHRGTHVTRSIDRRSESTAKPYVKQDDDRPYDARNRPTHTSYSDRDSSRGYNNSRQDEQRYDNGARTHDDTPGRGYDRGQHERGAGRYDDGPGRNEHGTRWGSDSGRGRYDNRGTSWRQEDAGRRSSGGRQYDGGPQHMNGGRGMDSGMGPPTATQLHVGGLPQDPRRQPQAMSAPAPPAPAPAPGAAPGAVYLAGGVGGAPTLLVAPPQAVRPAILSPNVILTSLAGHPHQLQGPGPAGPSPPVLVSYPQQAQHMLSQGRPGPMPPAQHQFQPPHMVQPPPPPPQRFTVVQHPQPPPPGPVHPRFTPMPPQQPPPLTMHQAQAQAQAQAQHHLSQAQQLQNLAEQHYNQAQQQLSQAATQAQQYPSQAQQYPSQAQQYPSQAQQQQNQPLHHPVPHTQFAAAANAPSTSAPKEDIFDKAALERLLQQVSVPSQSQPSLASPPAAASHAPPITTQSTWSPTRIAEPYSPRKQHSQHSDTNEAHVAGEYSPTAGRRSSSPRQQDGGNVHLNQLLALLGGLVKPNN